MRTMVPSAVFLALSLAFVQAHAASSNADIPNQQALDALEAKASQAMPREQSYLYAKLVRQMTELSLNQYQAGNVGTAKGLLKRIQKFSSTICRSLTGKDKRLKNTEILLRQTAFRLNELLHASDYQDRLLLEQTLAQVNQADHAAMMSVFSK